MPRTHDTTRVHLDAAIVQQAHKSSSSPHSRSGVTTYLPSFPSLRRICWVSVFLAYTTRQAQQRSMPPTAAAALELRLSRTTSRANNIALVTSSTGEKHREQQSGEQLRRTIEDTVLRGVANGIEEHVQGVENGERPARPFVTLTYAQSIDGSIAAADKSPVRKENLMQNTIGV